MSQPNGYCTVLGCSANSCPDNAACVVFGASVSGCPYDDYAAPSRTARAMCLKTCSTDSDCRQGDGYVCAQLSQPPWHGGPPWTAILDTNTLQRVCVVAASSTNVTIMDAAVCSSSRPTTPPLDAMVTIEDASPEVGDVGLDVPPEVGDAGLDSPSDVGDVNPAESAPPTTDGGSDAQTDVAPDAVADASVSDAPDGG